MTYRDRRAARADRLRGWADKRVTRAVADIATGDKYRGDHAFNTQPGIIPERTRLNARMHRAYVSLDKADDMARRADSIDRAAAHAIYSDDDDAIDRLTAKIADLDADRASIVAYNKAVRKAGKATADALALLSDKRRADLLSITKHTPYALRDNGAFPTYVTSNLSGNISRLRARLASLKGA